MFLFAFQHQKEADLRGSKQKTDKDHGTMEEKSSINENSMIFDEIHINILSPNIQLPRKSLEYLGWKKAQGCFKIWEDFLESSLNMGLNYQYLHVTGVQSNSRGFIPIIIRLSVICIGGMSLLSPTFGDFRPWHTWFIHGWCQVSGAHGHRTSAAGRCYGTW